MNVKMFKGPIEAATHIVKTSGFRGLYRGYFTNMVRDVPAACVYMTSYRWFQYMREQHFPIIPSQLVNFIGGGLAGVFSWAVILPLDVVKSKLQADACGQMYKGALDCARKTLVNEGPSAFMAGFIPMSIRAFFVNAAILAVYSESLKILNRASSS